MRDNVKMGDDKATHARRRLYYPVTVHSEADLRAPLYSYAVIELASNIFLASTITIFGVTNLVIHGNNHKIDGQGKVGCFSIEASSVEMKSLVVSNGKAEMGGTPRESHVARVAQQGHAAVQRRVEARRRVLRTASS